MFNTQYFKGGAIRTKSVSYDSSWFYALFFLRFSEVNGIALLYFFCVEQRHLEQFLRHQRLVKDRPSFRLVCFGARLYPALRRWRE